MKKVLLSMIALIGISFQSNAQCSDVENNFEMKLSNKTEGKISVQIRYHDDANKINNQKPTIKSGIDGLIFAISWPTTSRLKIESVSNANYPFSIQQDNTINTAQQKTTTDNMAVFYHNSDMPNTNREDWKNDVWYDVATINYTGKLAVNDVISFVTCDYGLAHPNSYSGNSHTDPWFAIMDMETKVYNQYSPKMITEIPDAITSSYNVYPNPSSDVFHVEVNTVLNTNVAIQLLDMNGKVIITNVHAITSGKNVIDIPVNELSAGSYSIKITDGKTLNYIQKVQKQ